jgi:hypothetical protein
MGNIGKQISLLVLGCLAVTVLQGCPADSKPPKPNLVIADLIPEQECNAMEKEILALASRLADQSCPRPVLRGQASQGRAESRIDALIDTSAIPRPCKDLLGKGGEHGFEGVYTNSVMRALFVVPADYVEAEDGPTPFFPLRTVSEVDDSAKFKSLRQACRPAMRHLQQAIGVKDACSPYVVGKQNDHPDTIVYVVRLVKVALLEATLLAKAGKVAEAFSLLLDLVRFGQDINRGGTNLILSMVNASAIGLPALEVVGNLLNKGGRIGAETLQGLQKELTILLGSQPDIGKVLLGEHLAFLLMHALPLTKPDGWMPPGGLYQNSEYNGTYEYMRPFARLVLLWGYERMKRYQALCADTAWLAECVEKIKSFETEDDALRATECADAPGGCLEKLFPKVAAGVLGNEKEKLQARQRLVQLCYLEWNIEVGDYVRKIGRVVFSLGAARLHAAFRERFDATRQCPTLQDFDRPPLLKLRTDPYSGKPMQIVQVDPRRYRLESPAPLWDAPTDSTYPMRQVWMMECPAARNKVPKPKVRKRGAGKR